MGEEKVVFLVVESGMCAVDATTVVCCFLGMFADETTAFGAVTGVCMYVGATRGANTYFGVVSLVDTYLPRTLTYCLRFCDNIG